MKKISIVVLTILLCLSIFPAVIFADAGVTFETGGMRYKTLNSNSVEIISKDPKYVGNIVIPTTVKYTGVEYSVTAIGDGAFYNCFGLSEITIPSTVTKIGSGAFYYCLGLKEIVIPNSVTTIGDGAFYYCLGLKKVTMSTELTSLGESAFAYCESLTSIDVPKNVTKIANSTFLNCKSLMNVTLGESIKIIDSWAFSNCTSLNNITIPKAVNNLGEGAFGGCSGLSQVNFMGDAPTTGLIPFYGIPTGARAYIWGTAKGFTLDAQNKWNGLLIDNTTNAKYFLETTKTEGDILKQSIVKLVSKIEGAKIYYTTNGAEPTIYSTLYDDTKGVVIGSDTVLKVLLVKDGNSVQQTYQYSVKKAQVNFKLGSENTRYIKTRGDIFAPDIAITRYEVIDSLNRLLDIDANGVSTQLTDVSNEYKSVVAKFQAAGIIDGFQDNTFKGNEGLTRAEFVKIMTVILNTQNNDGTSLFKDIDSHWAKSYISSFTKLGYIKGYADYTFKPDNKMTRAEFVTIMNRIMKVTTTDNEQPVFSDLKNTHWAFKDIMKVYIKQ